MENRGKSSTRAKNKYNAANYDALRIVVPKGRKADIDEHARHKGVLSTGLSMPFYGRIWAYLRKIGNGASLDFRRGVLYNGIAR